MGNRFPSKVSSKTKEKEALFVSGKLECNDPTKETTIVCDFLGTVDCLENRLQKVTPVSPYWEVHVVEENDPKEWLHMNSGWQIVTGETCKCNVVTFKCSVYMWGYCSWLYSNSGSKSVQIASQPKWVPKLMKRRLSLCQESFNAMTQLRRIPQYLIY